MRQRSAPIDYADPAAVEPLFAAGAGALGAFGVDPHLRDSRAAQWNLTIEHELPADVFLSVGYVGSHGSRLTHLWDANRALEPSLPGTPIVRPNPGFGAITVAGSIGTSDYHSFQVQLLRRAGRHFNWMAAYTLAKALGNIDGGNFGSARGTNQVQDIFDLDAARSIQSFDVRHRVSVSLQYDLPWFDEDTGLAHHLLGGWHVNAIFSAQTGSGNGVLYGSDTTNTGVGSWPDLIADPVLPGSERSVQRWFNTAAFVRAAAWPVREFAAPDLSTTPGSTTWTSWSARELALRKGMNAELRAEFFNLFNHTNFRDVDNRLTSPGFGTITSAADARIIQLGVKLSF